MNSSADDPAFSPEGLLLDLDGTLLDTTGALGNSKIRACAAAGYTLTWEMWLRANMLFDGSEESVTAVDLEIIRATRARISLEEFRRLVSAELELAYGAPPPWMPGARALLGEAAAAAMPRALVTNAGRPEVDAWLATLPEDMFAATVTITDVVRPKPHPEGYRLGAERIGVPVEKCLALEDSLAGYAAARAAGCRVVLVNERRQTGHRWMPTLRGTCIADLCTATVQ